MSLETIRSRNGYDEVAWQTASLLTSPLLRFGNFMVASAGLPHWQKEAAEIFSSLGFVAVLDALAPNQISELLERSRTIAAKVLQDDPARIGNRGPRRYSFGALSPTHHLMHLPEWPQLLDSMPVNALLSAIFPQGYLAAGGGGDFVLEEATTYQSLHLDIGGGPIYEFPEAPGVAVNFVLEDLSCADGPTRVLPGTHRTQSMPPVLTEEPENAKLGTLLCPLPAGAAIVRDLRAWHGGTPNGSERPRYLPNAEYVSKAWGELVCGVGVILDPCSPVLPKQFHDKLSPHAQVVSAGIVDTSGVLDNAGVDDSWMLDTPIDFMRHYIEAY